MIASGDLTGSLSSEPVHGSFTFWGEWEPQSFARPMNPSQPGEPEFGKPKWIHEPHLSLDVLATSPPGWRPSEWGPPGWKPPEWQNTDPLVLGDMFRYYCCRQFNPKSGARTKMSRLGEGDIVMFGSHLQGEFVLDTVFVVGVFKDMHSKYDLPAWQSKLHNDITVNLVDFPPCGLRMYGSRGWSAEEPKEPFSFTPCLPLAGEPQGFARPSIKPGGVLQSVINPKMKQNYKVTECGRDEVKDIWCEVVDQVLSAGCALATRIDEPV